MVQAWHQYGNTFSVFSPAEQPAPGIWEPDLPGFNDKERLHPDALKHWQYVFPTKDFLRHGYAKYKILQGPSLFFDCLVPRFQPGIHHKWAEDQYGQPAAYEVKDDYTWYTNAIRIGEFHCSGPKRYNDDKRDISYPPLIVPFLSNQAVPCLSSVAPGFSSLHAKSADFISSRKPKTHRLGRCS
jgi:hypothetical protein